MKNKDFEPTCPIPISDYPYVLLAHGGGGKLMHQLIEKMFTSVFTNPILEQGHDAAVIECPCDKLAMTTDSYVVHPLIFPGGNIGSLAVHGTVNDLAMSGARPMYLSAGFIIEEGLPMDTLWQIVQSMSQAARESNVQIVTGDTKVVDRGKGDGIFINTSGVGYIEHEQEINPRKVNDGDVIIVNGDIGRHGMAIMTVREGLSFDSTIESDSASLVKLVLDLFANDINIHCLRDLTRGGLASTLNEIATMAQVEININENDVPVYGQVHGACEILGFDPLYVACEGRCALFLPEKEADKALTIMRKHEQGKDATVIGTVKNAPSGIVTLNSAIGVERIIDMISGEQLPRIC